MRYRVAAALAVLACGLTAAAQDRIDARYVSKAGRFSVRFPPGVEVKSKTQDAPGVAKMVMAVAKAERKTHVVAYTVLPEGRLQASPAKTILDGAAAGAVQKGGKEVSRKDFTFGAAEHPAREVVVVEDGMTVRTRVIVADPKLFVLVVGGPDGYGTGKAATDFLDSFELLK